MQDELARLHSENLRLRDEVERLRSAASTRTIAGMTDLILVADRLGRLRYLNTAAESYFTVARGTVTGRPVATLTSSRLSGGQLATLLAEVIDGVDEVRTQASFRLDNGEVEAWELRATAVGEDVQFICTDRSELYQVRSALSRYISPAVMDDVLRAAVDPFIARKYELTVAFADLRGFTALSSSRTAEQVKQLIDEYLTVQIDVILGEGATIDKIVGDEVMALFGAPLQADDHALWAVNTALKMQAGHERLMAIWTNRGLGGCPLGIGVNSGEMVVGNIGSHKRMDYTVLGHNVNLAARLCSAAELGEILLSMSTFEAIKRTLAVKHDAMWCPVKFRRGRMVQAKGIAAAVETVSVVAG